ncbi:MAG: N-acetylmuramoyl-L-alanine amidase [Acidobacteriota bacterium]|nr:N-acetylmuramoyl-L-alanine amidase [Acidobacteriota bacterium]
MATGDDIFRLALKHVGEPYILGSVVPMNNKNWRGPWDCAEFVSWCVFQASGILYGCQNDHLPNPGLVDAFTGWWRRDADLLGTKIGVGLASQTVGGVVLRYPQPGMMGHIVICDGKGGTVEAHSHVDGVMRGVITGRRWDTGVLVPGIQYTQNATPVVVTPPTLIFRLTNPYMRGQMIRDIQAKLKSLGFNPGLIDGIYGEQTAAAVHGFQLSNGLLTDGEVGPETAKALGVALP